MTSSYRAGSVTLTKGSAVVKGNGTAWLLSNIAGGNVIVQAGGNILPIDTVDTDTQITAELEWVGESGTYPYSIQRDTAYLKTLDRNSDNLAYLLDELRKGTAFKYDASGSLADKALFDGRTKGFSYLVLAGDVAQLYVKRTDAIADWAGPYAYGTGPRGIEGPAGFVRFRGDYSAIQTYARNDGVYRDGSSWVALQDVPAGQLPPALPVTADAYWSLLAIKGRDGNGAGDMLASIYDPQGRGSDVFDALDKRLRSDAAQALNAAQKGRAIANIGGGVLAGHRNKIINGDFGIWQRGLGIGPFTGSQYTADRWLGIAGAGDTISLARYTWGSPDNGNPWAQSRYGIAVTGTGANSEKSLVQPIEDARTLQGKTVTLTFWCYNTTAGNLELAPLFLRNYGAGGSAGEIVADSGTLIAAPNTWVKFSRTYVIPLTTGKVIGDGSSLTVYLLRNNFQGTVYLSRVSVVEGDATAEADPFTPRHPQQELSLCERYFQILQCVIDPATQYRTVLWRTKPRVSPSLSYAADAASAAFSGSIFSPPPTGGFGEGLYIYGPNVVAQVTIYVGAEI
ncbi:hypothetical protein ACRQ1B_28985 [Rhizobium panacihumi]|uniref:hypothetical protein n=1 Tax=Rhizobium panacihumi TaxID=2008450 RepID=UPI003D7AC19D